MTAPNDDPETTKRVIQQVLAGELASTELEKFHPSELALHIHAGPAQDMYKLLASLPESFAAKILCEVQEDICQGILAIAELPKLLAWVKTLPTDESAYLIDQLEPEVTGELFQQLGHASGRDVQDILSYPEDQVGYIMQKEVIAVNQDETVTQAVAAIRQKFEGKPSDQYSKAYVVDAGMVLQGEISLLKLLMSQAGVRMRELMSPVVLKVRPNMEQAEVASMTLQYNEPSIPVVDDAGRLLGRLTLDDLGEVLVQEYEEDIGKMAGTGEEHAKESYWGSITQRTPWLLLGMSGGLFSAHALGNFENSLARFPEMVFFLPLITSMAGNVGIQSSSIIVRGFATGEILVSDLFFRLFKELRISLVTGCLFSFILLGFNFVMLGNLRFGLFVSFCLFLMMGIAAVIGTITPFVLKKCSIEPAYSTGPFITIGNDILGVTVYTMLAGLYITRFLH